MMMDIITLALSRSYADSLADSLGSLKGSPCTIKSQEELDDSYVITFEWVGTSGKTEEDTLIIKKPKNGTKGDPGIGILKIEKISTVDSVDTYRITFTDNSTFDYQVKNGSNNNGSDSSDTPAATITISNENDNILEMKSDGLYVKKPSDFTMTVNVLPDASEDNKGTILQYIGEDTDDYKHGGFYACILDEESEVPKYKWTLAFNDIYVEKVEGKGLSTNDYTDEDAESVSQIINKANKSNTLQGYGIDDAYTKSDVDNNFVKVEKGKSLISSDDISQISKNKSNLDTLMADANTNGSIANQIANSVANKDKIKKQVAEEVPTVDNAQDDILYLVPSGDTSGLYFQYMLIEGQIVPLGSTETDLTDYAKKDEIKDFITADDVAKLIPGNIATDEDLIEKLDINQGTDNHGKYLFVDEDGKVTTKELITGTSVLELEAREW